MPPQNLTIAWQRSENWCYCLLKRTLSIFYNYLANTLIFGGRLFKWSLSSLFYQNRVLSHFRFSQRIYLSTVYRGHFHEIM